jgi:hypothetical protein
MSFGLPVIDGRESALCLQRAATIVRPFGGFRCLKWSSVAGERGLPISTGMLV